MERFYLTINNEGDALTCTHLGRHIEEKKDCYNMGELSNFVMSISYLYGSNPNDACLLCSSLLDWPEDVPTVTNEVIDMCNVIRGNNIPHK